MSKFQKNNKRLRREISSLTVIAIFFSSPVLVAAYCPSHLSDQSANGTSASRHEGQDDHHHTHHSQHLKKMGSASSEKEHHPSDSGKEAPTCCSDGVKKDLIVSSPTELSFRELSKKMSLGVDHSLPAREVRIQSLGIYTHYGTSPPTNLALRPLYTQHSSLLI